MLSIAQGIYASPYYSMFFLLFLEMQLNLPFRFSIAQSRGMDLRGPLLCFLRSVVAPLKVLFVFCLVWFVFFLSKLWGSHPLGEWIFQVAGTFSAPFGSLWWLELHQLQRRHYGSNLPLAPLAPRNLQPIAVPGANGHGEGIPFHHTPCSIDRRCCCAKPCFRFFVVQSSWCGFFFIFLSLHAFETP